MTIHLVFETKVLTHPGQKLLAAIGKEDSGKWHVTEFIFDGNASALTNSTMAGFCVNLALGKT